ncbi:MAG: glycosyltransferase [Peptococcaceae bacterium]|nr:glycosyltransferase [Peptococcaceae bacterium]
MSNAKLISRCWGQNDFVASIIIPFYNKVEMTIQCVKSILSATEKGLYPCDRLEIVLVDDKSTERYCVNDFGYSQINIVRNDRNLGFSKSCNIGARAARGQYLIFLNNDTIAREGCFDELVVALESDPLVGVAGSKLLYREDTIQHAGIAFNDDYLPFHIYRHLPSSLPAANKRREFQAVTGACFIISADVFATVGGFDEGYRMGFEDIDLCLRIRRLGKKVLYCPSSCLYHLEYQTRSKSGGPAQAANLELFKRKWAGKVVIDYLDFYLEVLDPSQGLPDPWRALRTARAEPNPPVVVVWGAGSAGRHASKVLNVMGIFPDVFVDNDEEKWGGSVDGYPVTSPGHLKDLATDSGKSVYVIIASTWYDEIAEELYGIGLQCGKEFLSYAFKF